MTMRQLLTRFGQRSARATVRPIGADFAGSRLNLLQAEVRAGRWHLRAAASVKYPMPRADLLAAPKELARFVNAALASAPFQGRRVIAALAPADVRILPLTVHLQPGQPEAKAVAKAAAEQLGDSAADHVLDYYQVRGADSEGAERQVLVAAAPKPRVLAYLAALEAARLEPLALDIGPAAISRLLATLHGSDVGQSVALLNFGSGKSYLTVIWGRRLMLDREIDFGEQRLARRLATALDLPADTATHLLREHGIGGRPGGAAVETHSELGRAIREILHADCQALADELAHTQVYVASRTRGSSIARVYLNGSLARYPDIQTRIGELIDVPVHLLNPLDAFDHTLPAERSAALATPIALAAGLALRGGLDA
ncbi:Tfp pilus assembly PilM family ATPase [Pseudoduganella lurida]|uniref:Tfp pilus assembly PilM family ATPase n=1 Tax=Pseudoduganella lurida TaxID=1036180 RepID=A0A562RL32_9BURK|nr:pilus assembly protein PilM [Pseudoduganella lurida]TWI69758.1 Tfp pilus assembly PilM family ATPase [Pseudoduganella lurida]